MIESQGVYEIVYRKENEERIWHISSIEISKDSGDNCITAFCHEIEQYLNFSIMKILSVQKYWIDIFDKNDLAPESGVYLFTCRGDNHLITELHSLEKGEPLYKFFEGDYSHSNGWFTVIPLAYHRVSDLKSGISEYGWTKMPEQLRFPQSVVTRIIAFKSEEPLELFSYVANDKKGIQYYLLDSNNLFGPKIPFSPQGDTNFTPLGLYTAISYTEMNHSIHWRLYEKKHPKENK